MATAVVAVASSRINNDNDDDDLHTSSTCNDYVVVVVGKIIVDEYGTPTIAEAKEAEPEPGEKDAGDEDDDQGVTTTTTTTTMGGGGPQAAFGAAAALAVWECYYNYNYNHNYNYNSTINLEVSAQQQQQHRQHQQSSAPPAQPVVFVGPVGNDWTDHDTTSLQDTLLLMPRPLCSSNSSSNCTSRGRMMQYDPILLQPQPQPDTDTNTNTDTDTDTDNGYYYTPRIRLWHECDGANNQNVRWYAKNDSFGPKGADGLWKNRPSVQELISIVQSMRSDDGNGHDDTTTTNDANDDIDSNEEEKNKLATTTTTTPTTTVKTTAILHLIAEASTQAAGKGDDWKPLLLGNTSRLIRNTFDYIGVEPVANINNHTLSYEDAQCAIEILLKDNNTDKNRTNNNNNNNTSSSSSNSMVNFFCPDRDLDQALQQYNLYDRVLLRQHLKKQERGGRRKTYQEERNEVIVVATRDGPRGSTLQRLVRNTTSSSTTAITTTRCDDDNTNATNTRQQQQQQQHIQIHIPAATLDTEDGQPINPTGAGNAYSAAMTALLGLASSSSSASLLLLSDNNDNHNNDDDNITSCQTTKRRRVPTVEEAAAIATGVGAIVCEYPCLPLAWDWSVLDRIYEASVEVQTKQRRSTEH